jgi:hypothetical protein
MSPCSQSAQEGNHTEIDGGVVWFSVYFSFFSISINSQATLGSVIGVTHCGRGIGGIRHVGDFSGIGVGDHRAIMIWLVEF